LVGWIAKEKKIFNACVKVRAMRIIKTIVMGTLLGGPRKFMRARCLSRHLSLGRRKPHKR
jgi:hypothetical protein